MKVSVTGVRVVGVRMIEVGESGGTESDERERLTAERMMGLYGGVPVILYLETRGVMLIQKCFPRM